MSPTVRRLSLALALAFATATPGVVAAPQAQDGAPLAEAPKSLYWKGHEALGRSDWSGAHALFRELERELARGGSEPPDAAIYWQAYALVQARRMHEAQAQIERLRREYPRSNWLDDAESLSAQVKSGQSKARDTASGGERTGDPREEDALMALDALLAGGNPKAVPMLRKVLAGNHGDRVKRRAMFVLSQIDPVAAEAEIQTLLAGEASTRLKAEAIRMIAAGGRPESLDRLLPIYRDAGDAAIKRSVLDAFAIGDRTDLMLQVVRSEADARQRRDAIRRLGAMGKGAELKSLYASLGDTKDRRSVLEGLGIANDAVALAGIARTEADATLRAAAIRAIGIAGGDGAAATLAGFYRADQPREVRLAVIEALMIANEGKTLVHLYREETEPDLKRRLLQMITVSDGDAALELIDQALQR